MANTVRIAERCNVEFDFEHRHLPNFPLPEGMRQDSAPNGNTYTHHYVPVII